MELHEFLRRGRTLREICEELGVTDKAALRWIKQAPEGYKLFTQRNAFNEQVFVYLPVERSKERPKRPIFARSVAAETPWVRVQFPDRVDFKRLDLVPLFDVHYGHHACKIEKWLEYVEFIKNTPGVYTFLGGDLIENSSKLSVAGGVYEQVMTPDQQIGRMIDMLTPIAHKILFSLPGNHEERAMKHLGIDVGRIIADGIGVPYIDGPTELDINWRGYTWRHHAMHGASSSQTPGGKINAAMKPILFHADLIHFFWSGHVHDENTKKLTRLVRNYETGEIDEVKYFVIVMPAMLGYFKTYGWRSGWSPPSSGSVRASMYPNGDYHIGS